MKKIIITIIGLIILSGINAQSRTPDDLDIVQSIFGKEKKELTEIYMNLSGKADTAFWPIYSNYEAERRELVRKRLDVLAQYTDNYATLTDATVDKLTQEAFKNMKDIDNLHKKYYKKMKKAVGALNASRFMQMEIYLQREFEAAILEEIPFIGDLK